MHHPQAIEARQPYPAQRVCRPQLAAEAREATADFLAGFHPRPDAHTSQDLLLLVSELVSNALRHAGAVAVLRLTADRHNIQVVVADPSPAHPQDRSSDLTSAEGGRGWPMIRRLAHGITIRPRPRGGKTIQVTIPR